MHLLTALVAAFNIGASIALIALNLNIAALVVSAIGFYHVAQYPVISAKPD